MIEKVIKQIIKADEESMASDEILQLKFQDLQSCLVLEAFFELSDDGGEREGSLVPKKFLSINVGAIPQYRQVSSFKAGIRPTAPCTGDED